MLGQQLVDVFLDCRLHFLCGCVFLQQLRFHSQIFEKAADRCDFARTGVRTQAVFQLVRIRLLDAVARQIGQKTVNLRECHCTQKGNIDICDGDLVQFSRARYEPTIKLQKPQEHPQIKIILIDRSLGMSADRFMINQKVAQHLRRIRIVHTQHLNNFWYEHTRSTGQSLLTKSTNNSAK